MKLPAPRVLVPLTVVMAAGLAWHSVGPPRTRDPGPAMAAAAQAWLDTLSDDLKKKAQLAFDDAERTQWSYFPGERAGVTLAEMDARGRRAAHALLQSALSQQGYLKTTTIVSLEDELRRMVEARGGRADHRDPLLYTLAVFGEPGSGNPWGWRFEGHHVSLNYSTVSGFTAWAPAFFGANPAEVRSGPRAGLRALAPEEDLARRLVTSLDADQRKVASIAVKAPADILLGPGKKASVEAQEGIRQDSLTEPQQALLWELIATHAGNQRQDLATRELDRIRKAGLEKVRFAWAGGTEAGQPHYYRISGPTFVVEYDDVQDGANHIHTVWRDPANEFGADLLRRHHQEDPHHRGR